ncbi:type VII toxin-antitoxin system MntA family adenylyltransferase antitoxin [Lentibacillus daqui]|uniref:type VII toxin-antitoxin system MntA family adenylyltransferase antitoxin n=1 Tax=Lentibacillus daqui TaxID=2911514 RepID=UPI0022B150DB|nr:nucleotidyltransferase domain-containing protein [Lentibacillus daqui]
MLTVSQTDQIKSILLPALSPVFIYLFGSTAKNQDRKTSDIDLAFLNDQTLSPYDIFMIGQRVASALDKDVDLVDLRQASTVMQLQIVHYGKLLYCADENRRMAFEMNVYKMYAKLNEEREVILKTIGESGEIYGK